MANYKQNGIDFNLNADVVTPFPGKYTNDVNYDFSTGLYAVDDVTQFGAQLSINAVEIDWNGAEVIPGKTLNTTGEVLSSYKIAI